MKSRVFMLIFGLLIVVHLWLVGSRRLLPYTDLPNHKAIATIVRHYDETPGTFAQHYLVDTRGKANTYFWNFCRMPIFSSVEQATRAYYLLYIALLPLAALAAIRRLGGNQWFALLSFLLLYNFNVTWGFVGFTLGVPVFLLLFTVVADDNPGRLHYLVAAALLVCLFFIHAMVFLFAAGFVVLAAAFTYPREPRRLLGPALALLPALALFAAWWLRQPPVADGLSLRESLFIYYTGPFWLTIVKRLGFLVFDNYRLFPRYAGYAVATLFSLGIVIPALAGLLRRRALPLPRALWAFLAFAAFCFFLLPAWMPGHWAIFQRFSVFFLLALMLAGSCFFAAPPTRAWVGIFALLAVTHAALWGQYHVAFDHDARGFDAAFLPPGGAGVLAAFVTDADFRGRPVYTHFPSYHTVWKRGPAVSRIYDYRFGAVTRRPGAPPLPAYVDFIEDLQYDGRYADVDWLLTHGDPPPTAAAEMNDFQVGRHAGAWSLYRHTKEQ